MKRTLLVLITIILITTGKAQNVITTIQTNQGNPADVLVIREMEHDFGSIPQGKPVYYFFEISNNGQLPLKLDKVQPSCGCTTPEWSKEPIPAGGSDKIKIGYNAANEGEFAKYITITYNGNQTKQIKIKGTVWKAPPGSAPLNASVQFLKQQIQ